MYILTMSCLALFVSNERDPSFRQITLKTAGIRLNQKQEKETGMSSAIVGSVEGVRLMHR